MGSDGGLRVVVTVVGVEVMAVIVVDIVVA